MGVGVGAFLGAPGLGVDEPVAALALEAVFVEEAAIEPDRRVEGGVLVDEKEGELGLEERRRGGAGEVAPLFAGLADRARHPSHDLAGAVLAPGGVGVHRAAVLG